VAVQEDIRDAAGGILVGELQGLGAEPLHADDDQPIGHNATNSGMVLEVFETAHARNSSGTSTGARAAGARHCPPLRGDAPREPSSLKRAGTSTSSALRPGRRSFRPSTAEVKIAGVNRAYGAVSGPISW
jgi:hypothetical protein